MESILTNMFKPLCEVIRKKLKCLRCVSFVLTSSFPAFEESGYMWRAGDMTKRACEDGPRTDASSTVRGSCNCERGWK